MDQEAKKTCNDCDNYSNGLCMTFNMKEGFAKDVFPQDAACIDFISKIEKNELAKEAMKLELLCNLRAAIYDLKNTCNFGDIQIIEKACSFINDLNEIEEKWENESHIAEYKIPTEAEMEEIRAKIRIHSANRMDEK